MANRPASARPPHPCITLPPDVRFEIHRLLRRRDQPTNRPLEGGDVHVIGHRNVLIGMGERTSPMAVEMVAKALSPATRLIR